jgi:hypothetical protein
MNVVCEYRNGFDTALAAQAHSTGAGSMRGFRYDLRSAGLLNQQIPSSLATFLITRKITSRYRRSAHEHGRQIIPEGSLPILAGFQEPG